MYIADPLIRIVHEDNIAPQSITPEDEAGRGVSDGSRQPQYQGVVAFGIVQAKVTRVVLEIVVGVDTISIGSTNDMWIVFASESEDFLSCGFGVWVENAYDVGYIVVREAGILLA